MDISYHRNWFQKQIEKADKLIEIYGEDGVSDAEIILCCTASALASTIWQRRNHKDKFDRKRFIEFLVKFSTVNPSVETVCISILAQYLEESKKDKELQVIIKKFFKSELNYFGKSPFEYDVVGSGLYAGTLSEVITPEEIDTSETEISKLLPSLTSNEIRKASYASAIYSDLRSGLIHEYEITGGLSSFGWAHKGNNKLDYVNFSISPTEQEVNLLLKKHNIEPNEARDALTKTQRKLYFPYSYIKDIISSASNALFTYWENVEDFNQPYPQKWWVDEQ